MGAVPSTLFGNARSIAGGSGQKKRICWDAGIFRHQADRAVRMTKGRGEGLACSSGRAVFAGGAENTGGDVQEPDADGSGRPFHLRFRRHRVRCELGTACAMVGPRGPASGKSAPPYERPAGRRGPRFRTYGRGLRRRSGRMLAAIAFGHVGAECGGKAARRARTRLGDPGRSISWGLPDALLTPDFSARRRG